MYIALPDTGLKFYAVPIPIHKSDLSGQGHRPRKKNMLKHDLGCPATVLIRMAGLGGSVGCAIRLEIRRLRVRPPPRSPTFFRGD